MIDRRRFLKLFTGGLAAAAHGGVPALLLRPVVRVVVDETDRFEGPLVGLLTNARLRAVDWIHDGVDWRRACALKDQGAGR